MKACVTYTILDIVEIEDYNGTAREFEEAVAADAQSIAEEIFNAVGLHPNDIEIDVLEDLL